MDTLAMLREMRDEWRQTIVFTEGQPPKLHIGETKQSVALDQAVAIVEHLNDIKDLLQQMTLWNSVGHYSDQLRSIKAILALLSPKEV